MSQIQFSIVITTYNRLPLLRRAIAAALAQTVSCEVIVVDDCSSDGTEAFVCDLIKRLREQGNTRLVYHRNSTNLGHSKTMNVGVQLAQGDWIKPVDDDDYLAPNCIQEMSEAIALHPKAVLCSCLAAQVDVNQVVLSITRKTGPGKAFYIPQEDIHYGMLLEVVPFGTPIQVAFSRAAFLKSGGWDSSLDTNFDDIDSWIKIAQYGDAIFINECLSYRTIWPGAYNQKFRLQIRLDIHILMKRKIYALVSEKHKPSLPPFQSIEKYLKLHWTLAAIKNGKFSTALEIASPAILSFSAWKLLLNRANLTRYDSSLKGVYSKNINNYFSYLKIKKKLSKKHIDKIQLKTLRGYLKFRCSLATMRRGNTYHAATLALQSLKLIAVIRVWHLSNKLKFFSKKEITQELSFSEKIYSFISQNPDLFTADIRGFRAYIKLRWSLLLFRKGQFFPGIKACITSLISLIFWKIMAKISLLNIQSNQQTSIQRIVLIDI